MTAPLRIGTGLPGPGPDVRVLRDDDPEAWSNLDKLLGLQCTLREIAAFFECDEDTISNRIKAVKHMRFSEYAAMVKPRGLVSLRRKQMELALQGDRTMLIWLGKQYLGQTDKVSQQISGPDGRPIEIQDATDSARVVLNGLAQIAARQQIARDVAHPMRALASDNTADPDEVRVLDHGVERDQRDD